MLTQQDLDRICELANQVEDKLQDLGTETLTGLLDAVQKLQGDATELRGLVEDIELDESELGELVPENLSAGEADSLRDAVNDWREKNGYPRI
jgi:predicted nuclease with TOPRIM domain